MRKIILILAFLLSAFILNSGNLKKNALDEFHKITSHEIMSYINELCNPKYEGRLTGTRSYNMAAGWVVSKLREWGVDPGGDNGSYYQDFKNPYTLVLPGGYAKMIIPVGKSGNKIEKNYRFEKDFIPGSTSGSGVVTGEVVYVGYGISAPELNYDEYKGLDVKGKIVLMEREVPVSSGKDPALFKKWRPYSFHQYKVKNAKKHGAAGMMYIYRIANPNCDYIRDLVVTYVGESVVKDIFAGTGKTHKGVLKRIKKRLKPGSFKTKKVFSIKSVTEHHQKGVSKNVLGIIEGSDAKLKNDVIVISAHLDHVGKNPLMVPGANDNASGVGVVMSVARVLGKMKVKPKRTIMFAFFGAEEQGVKGSEFFLKNFSLKGKKIINCINLDGVGRGDKILFIAGKNFPEIMNVFKEVNDKYIFRKINPIRFLNNARPRLDAAHFMWAGIPTVSISAYGMDLPFSVYHKTLDKPKYLTPEIMEDLGKMIFLSVLKLAGN